MSIVRVEWVQYDAIGNISQLFSAETVTPGDAPDGAVYTTPPAEDNPANAIIMCLQDAIYYKVVAADSEAYPTESNGLRLSAGETGSAIVQTGQKIAFINADVINSGIALGASEEIIGAVIRPGQNVQYDLSPYTTAVTEGKVIVSAMELINFARTIGGRSWIQSLVLLDNSANAGGMTLYFSTSANQPGAPGADVDFSGEVFSQKGYIEIPAEAFKTVGNKTMATLTNITLPIQVNGSTTSIYMTIVSEGANDFTTDCLSIIFGIVQD